MAGKAILSLGSEELKLLLLCSKTCSPLSVPPSRQTSCQAFVAAAAEICRGGEGLLARGTDHDQERQMHAALLVALYLIQGSSAG